MKLVAAPEVSSSSRSPSSRTCWPRGGSAMRRSGSPEPGGPATYEQIFWFTQTAMRQRRPRGVRLHSAKTDAQARVRIASDKTLSLGAGRLRYRAWTTARRRLCAGDGEQILAVVERKTFEGLLADFGGWTSCGNTCSTDSG